MKKPNVKKLSLEDLKKIKGSCECGPMGQRAENPETGFKIELED